MQNSSFEVIGINKTRALFWHEKNTADFYHLKAKMRAFQPTKASMSVQYRSAHTGSAFAGFLTGWEVLFGECKEPLKEGHTYHAEVWLSAKKRGLKTSTFWIWLTDSLLNRKPIEFFYDPPAQFINHKDSFIISSNWKKVEGNFVAKGGEKYVVIGSLSNTPKYYQGGEGAISTYLYLDDVSITDITPGFQFETDKPIRLENIFFNTGKSELLPASFAELDKLYEHLEAKPDQKLEIAGHTDNVGQKKANQTLSAARAKAVHDYLVGKGIAKERLSYIGFGSTKPVADNATKQGRQQNRRVEVRLVK